MTVMKEKAEKVWSSVCEATWDVDTTYFEDSSDCKKFITTALKEVVNQLGYTHLYLDGDHGLGVVNIRDIMSIIEELEKL